MSATSNRSWRAYARAVIHRAVAEAQAQGLAGAALIAAIDARYPFGERAHYPYQVWLVERNRVLVELGLAMPTKALLRLQRWERGEVRQGKRLNELIAAGQLPLIGDE